mgnify:CR=1 FL=1
MQPICFQNAKLRSVWRFCLFFKQGLFALKTRLVYNAKKASLQCKEAFFSMGRIFAARGEGAPYSRVTKCMVPGTSSKRVPLSLSCTMAVRRGSTCVSL